MAATEWISAIDKRPGDRSRRDADLIAHRLRRVEALDRLPPSILHQLALVGYYEDLEKGVTLFRQGDPGSSWYAVLAGSVEVRYEGADPQTALTLCTLGVGSTFGESILNPLPRDTTVLTRTTCELLRVERRDFKAIWEKNKDTMDHFVSSCKINNKNGYTSADTVSPGTPGTPASPSTTPMTRRSASPEDPDPAKPITDAPGAQAVRIGYVLRHLLTAGFAPESLRGALTMDSPGQVIFARGRRAWTGSDLVDWLMEASGGLVRSRQQACAMWQCLLEEGVILHVAGELPFLDSDAFYRFFMDTPPGGDPLPTQEEYEGAEDDLHDAIDVMNKRAPHATLRYILRKPPHERSDDDLEMVYDELMRIRALSHLGNSVRRELAHVIVFESHPKAGEVLFQQGDEGHSWYIILRGSVDVVIHGKGVVTTLAEGDDFGKLALINDAPRAASIVLREPNCHFLRVDKDHFNRILRDVEANTVRLKEHGQDVLVLEKISNAHSHFKYTVMAGTSQKMLEHLLETRLVGGGSGPNGQEISSMYGDPFLEDFLLTHIVFMPTQQLVSELARHYRIEPSPAQEHDFVLACKRRVVQFVNCWVHTVRHPVFDDPHSLAFLEELVGEVEQDAMTHPGLQEEASLMHHVTSQLRRYQEDRAAAAGQKWKLPPCGQPVAPFSNATSTRGRAVIRPSDDIIFRVYCADHTYCTLRCPVSSTAEHIKLSAADKLKLGPTEDLVLVEVRSSGERVVIADTDLSVPTGLGGLNARLFVAPREHIDALTPLPEQEGATEAMEMDLELFSMKELAYHMTLFDWDLFWSVHEYELLYKTFGRQSFNQITANLDVFLRRFNEIQYWVITEVCLATQLSKRVSVLRKMIKLAQYCRDFKNLNALFAIVMGLGNVAVSRLSLTWEKLPSKSRKLFTELEALIDPTRNHRAYRIAVGRLSPPVIPFMPLLIKDMTFTHEGNKTFQDGHLVNFEKMHMLAQTMRSIRNCRSRHLVLEPFSPKCEQDVKDYIASLRVIDNARTLSSLSQKLEPRRS